MKTKAKRVATRYEDLSTTLEQVSSSADPLEVSSVFKGLVRKRKHAEVTTKKAAKLSGTMDKLTKASSQSTSSSLSERK